MNSGIVERQAIVAHLQSILDILETNATPAHVWAIRLFRSAISEIEAGKHIPPAQEVSR